MRGCLLLLLATSGLPTHLAGPGAAGALEAQTTTRPEVVSLRFEGNETFSNRALSNAIVTRETTCSSTVLVLFCLAGREFAIDRSFLNPRDLQGDFARVHLFYRVRGYREVQVDTVIARHEDLTAEIVFRIDEGDPYRVETLDMFGLEALEDPSLTEDLPISVGDRLDLIQLDATRDSLTQRLQNRGYAHADVLRSFFIPAGTRDAEVEFDIYTGPRARFGPIEVVGHQEVAESVIRRMIPFAEGSPYSREGIFEAQRNLYNLEIFRHAAVVPDLTHEPDSIVPLTVQVNEGDVHRVRAGGGWNSADCISAESRWASRNFVGGARRLVLRGRMSNLLTHTLDESVCSGAGTGVYGDPNWLISADFNQPFIFSPRHSLAVSIYTERQSLQDVFIRQAVGMNLGLTRRLSRGTPLTLSYRPQLARLDAAEIFFCTSFLVCDPLDIDLLQASNWLAPVGLGFSRDRANRAISPTGGYTGLLEVEHAASWTGSDFEYQRALTEGTLYLGFRDDELVLASRLRGGWLRTGEFRGLAARVSDTDSRIAHPQTRFYAGGAHSVRGYAQNQLGPKVLSVQVEDLVFPVGEESAPVCSPEEVASLVCDAGALGDRRFFARPTGGSRLVEGNVELRFPLWGPAFRGAVFVDVGRVWTGAGEGLRAAAVTPGFGLRYATPIGPIRVDVAYRGRETDRLPVVTSQLRPFDPAVDPESARLRGPGGEVLDWVRLDDLAPLGPRVLYGEESDSFWNRIQFQFSIGQAF